MKLSWIFAACLTAACASAAKEPDISILGDWRIEDVDGGGVIDSTRLEVKFSEDGKVAGFAGCNNFMGGYTRDKGIIDIGPLASTKRACVAEALNQQETRVLASLDAVIAAAVGPDKSLVLTGPSPTQLILRRLDASAAALAPLEVTGSVFFLEKIALPPNAVLRITAEDVAMADAAAKQLATLDMPATNGPPFAFTLNVPPEKLNAQSQVAVRAQILNGDKLMFTSTERHSVPLEGERPPLKIRVSIVK
ncbi:MAG: META domain-containing protein [Caulobacterales bacterium]